MPPIQRPAAAQPVAEPVARMIDAFSRLPGIGPKTASRLTFYLLRAPEEQSLALADALRELKAKTVFCQRCFNIAESSPCPICASDLRDQSMVCVVEEPLDILAIERARAYRGLYHVLHGHISPLEGIGPEELKIAELIKRLEIEPLKEVVLATNPTTEGEATAATIERLISTRKTRSDLRVTRLARGLPVGGDLEYADEVTLTRAFEGRREL